MKQQSNPTRDTTRCSFHSCSPCNNKAAAFFDCFSLLPFPILSLWLGFFVLLAFFFVKMFSTFLRHPFFSYVFVFHDRRPKTERAVERAPQPAGQGEEKKLLFVLVLLFLLWIASSDVVRRRKTYGKVHEEKRSLDGQKYFSDFPFDSRACVCVNEEHFYNKENLVGKSWRILTTQLALFSQLLKLKKRNERKEAFLSVAALDIYLFFCACGKFRAVAWT